SPLPLLAGDLNSPAAPTDAGSAMFTIEDIYKRLDTGEEATAPSGGFTEPTSAPGSTGHTLTEVYEKADAAMNKVGVPKTGQTKCYKLSDHSEETCAVEHKGQDGNSATTVGISASPRFTENSDGTVTDNLTGLIWLQKANCIQSDYSSFDTDGTNGDGKVTWEHALDFVIGINDGTYSNCGASQTDWRLPNVKEFQSLINFGYASPALSNAAGTAIWTDGDAFSGVQTSYYWSSTTYASNSIYAWYVSLGNGHVNNDYKTNTYYIWPVRGRQ
ncbi:MAG: DUF1566 domain-containing protein, partial [Thiomargarita sp.]|nr:DUF1566 domain-containing protein [Thiomargarita sp.]